MPRKGQQLEDWGEEVIDGTPTVNSGAKYEDADMKVGGVGGRLYEFKSSAGTGGISIRRDHVRLLLERAIKLTRDPVFIFRNNKNMTIALVPFVIFNKRMKQFDEHGYYPENVQALQHAFQTLPQIQSKGDNIRIPEKDLKDAMELNGVMIYRQKNGIPWVVMEAMTWLEFIGDKKEVTEER